MEKARKVEDRDISKLERNDAREENDPKIRVQKLLSNVIGGESLARYFGISGYEPEQPVSQALIAEKLIEELREVSKKNDGKSETANLLRKVSAHAGSSKVDPAALRRLMYRKKVSK